MPAARYWRAVGLQSVGAGALELSAFHLYLAGSRVDAAATLTCTVPPSAGAVANLQDNDTSTVCRWLDVSAPGFALVWDFGVGVTQDVLALRLGAGALPAEWLDNLTLQSSSDGILWTTWGFNISFTWPGAGTLQTTPADGDAHIHSTSLLLHCEGPNGSTALVDSSLAPLAMTVVGAGKISTAQSKFGGSSFDITGSSYGGAAAPSGAASLTFGTGDFTVEFWVWASLALQTTGYPRLLAAGNYMTPGGWNLVYMRPSGGALILDFYDSGGTALGLPCGTLPDNTWKHVAFTRQGATVRSFMDGVLQGSGTSSVDLGTSLPFTVGSESYGASIFKGFFDEIRVTKGVARYVANFTPPTEPYPPRVGSILFRPRTAPASICLSGGMAGTTGTVLVPPSLQHDLQDGGQYRVYGTVHLDATPTDLPLRRRVQLYNQRDGRLIREAWSEATTGAYSFDGIRGGDGTRYFVATFDHTQGKRAVIADGIIPEVSA